MSAFAGYWVKVNGVILPTRFIKLDTLKITPRMKLDKNSFRNANGVLNRTRLPHRVSKFEFMTVPMHEPDMLTLCNIVTDEDKATVEFYNSKGGEYIEEYMYTPDIEFQVYNSHNNNILYNSMRLAFIGY